MTVLFARRKERELFDLGRVTPRSEPRRDTDSLQRIVLDREAVRLQRAAHDIFEIARPMSG